MKRAEPEGELNVVWVWWEVQGMKKVSTYVVLGIERMAMLLIEDRKSKGVGAYDEVFLIYVGLKGQGRVLKVSLRKLELRREMEIKSWR